MVCDINLLHAQLLQLFFKNNYTFICYTLIYRTSNHYQSKLELQFRLDDIIFHSGSGKTLPFIVISEDRQFVAILSYMAYDMPIF